MLEKLNVRGKYISREEVRRQLKEIENQPKFQLKAMN